MNKSWFRKVGWIYAPTTWQGIFIIILFVLFCINVFIAMDRRSHSVSDTLYGTFPYVIPAFLVYLWIGSEASHKK
jgi:hypothetical protein